ncbi:MAG: thioesterase family protein [Legionellaceae bacterium]|nr:thioesterase family protein [Legionellaceae bacterium]
MDSSELVIHEKTFNIHWGDMDGLNHMNNCRYFDYFQECRIDWLASMKLDLNQAEGPVVLKIACTYLKPIVYPAQIKIISKLQHIGRTSLDVTHDVYENDEISAQGTCKIVWINFKKGKSIPLPEIFKSYKL